MMAKTTTGCRTTAKYIAWSISQDAFLALGTLYSKAQDALQAALNEETETRSKVMNAQCRTAFAALAARMRDIKKRWFYELPLTEAGIVSLGLRRRDTTPTPGGENPGGGGTRLDFTLKVNSDKLGLSGTSYTANTLISAMNDRWNNTQNTIGGGGHTKFYPVSTASTVNNITVDGEILNEVGIYGMSPEMIFLLKGLKLTIWGRNNDTGVSVTISFDIAIINNGDGKGWLLQGPNGAAYKTESYPDAEVIP